MLIMHHEIIVLNPKNGSIRAHLLLSPEVFTLFSATLLIVCIFSLLDISNKEIVHVIKFKLPSALIYPTLQSVLLL